jgi:ribosomal protein S18 acetylase RimI-like enzyme
MPGTDVLTATVMDDHPIWAACVFLEAPPEADAETVRGEYARRAAEWPELHFAIVQPVTPGGLDPWYRLGFAQMHAYGLRESGGARVEAPGVSIRRAGLEQLETAIRIDRLIDEAQAAAPSFSTFFNPDDRRRQDWEETLADDEVWYFLAERDGEPLGHLTLYADPHDSEALHIASTAVLPEARGSGIGLALTSQALVHAHEHGLPRVWTNWRVTNLGASRFWPARGFRVERLRLVRRLPTL